MHARFLDALSTQEVAELLMSVVTKAAVAHQGERDFHWESVTLDDARSDEVVVRMIATGICHTDLSVLAGKLPTPLPAVLGHEGSGIVESVGSAVTSVQPGQTVVLSFASCGVCSKCRTGQPTRCPSYFRMNFSARRTDSSTPIRDSSGQPIGGLFFGQSSLSEIAVVAEQCVVPVDVSDNNELSLFAPIGCGIQTGAGAVLNTLKPGPGQSIAILGAGAVGLSAVMAARLTGARDIVAIDRVESRLTLASELGATATATSLDGHDSFDYIIETTAVPTLLEQSIGMLLPGGTVAVIGAPAAGTHIQVDVNSLIDGRSIVGITEGASDRITFIPALIDLYRRGRFPIDRLVKTYSMDRLDAAVADMRAGVTIKPVIQFEGSK